ncbi:unnamed protein product [Owenia fusiformis]|uniref:Anion exchange protein n=1 Tax=Owenia fusiformis TaxID=6347 RepID=A0A8J1Y460_OWEFU|nr:unnamed protein product [Owenia fusiformis]
MASRSNPQVDPRASTSISVETEEDVTRDPRASFSEMSVQSDPKQSTYLSSPMSSEDFEKLYTPKPKRQVSLVDLVGDKPEPTQETPNFDENDFDSHRREGIHMHQTLKSLHHSRGTKAAGKHKPKSLKSKGKVKSVPAWKKGYSPDLSKVEELKQEMETFSKSIDEKMKESPEEDGKTADETKTPKDESKVDHGDVRIVVEDVEPSSSTVSPQPSSSPRVGFYVGEIEGGSPVRRSTPEPAGPDVVDSKLLPPTTSPSSQSVESVAAQAFKRNVSQDPVPSTMFQGPSEEPSFSASAKEPQVPESEKVERTDSVPKVSFVVGLGKDGEESDGHEEQDGYSYANHDSGEDIPGQLDIKKPRKYYKKKTPQLRVNDQLSGRSRRGSDIKLNESLRRVPTEQDEASMLKGADLDEMASNRFQNLKGLRRPKAPKNAMYSIVQIAKQESKKLFPLKKKFDHSPHEVFVELEELEVGDNQDYEWHEKARWIKFEEDVEEGANRWGKPHVASLSFHSLLELRKCLEEGTIILDMEDKDLPSIASAVVNRMAMNHTIRPEDKDSVLRALLFKHKHVAERKAFLPRNVSYKNLLDLDQSEMYKRWSRRRGHTQEELVIDNMAHNVKKASSMDKIESLANDSTDGIADALILNTQRAPPVRTLSEGDGTHVSFSVHTEPDKIRVDIDNNMEDEKSKVKKIKSDESDILKRIPKGAEATTVLVGTVDFLEKPTMAFVRLSQGRQLRNLTEVPLPVRFIFLLLGPPTANMDYHEIGRSISTLMSNEVFHETAYKAEERSELLSAINEFLDDSMVLPPGDWDKKTLMPIMDMAKKNLRRRKKAKKAEEKAGLVIDKGGIPVDPLKRTGKLFGGLVNDIKRRYPHYLSDIKDGLNFQCFASFIFIYFACLAPAITFGGLLGEKMDNLMGVTETMLASALGGLVFAAFSGQPLVVIGATGPTIVFEVAIYKFCKSIHIEFMPMRVWIGAWVALMSIIVVALEGSFVIRYVTRFTEEIFALLISFIFIYEVFKKLATIFIKHPLAAHYPPPPIFPELNSTLANNLTMDNYTLDGNASFPNPREEYDYTTGQPNTALLSVILTFGTFFIAYFLKQFRNSKFLGRNARRAVGDFGIPIAIIIMVLVDYSIQDTYTQKLNVPDGLSPTDPKKRGWFINPMGINQPFQVWQIFAAIIPALLIFILMFMEIQITSVIVNKKERKLRKGSGYHLDLLLIGFFSLGLGLFGMPLVCSAAVRTVAHVSSLTIMSKTHAPGEQAKIVEVKEQRVTNVAVHLMIGVSVLMGPVLRQVPIAVLFGVFMYMGVASMSGIQLLNRVELMFMPVKHHPDVGYVRRVRSVKMHLYTCVQLLSLAALWVVKSTEAALAFPFVLILTVPLRLKLLKYIFTEKELHELDKEEESEDEDEDEPDFYQQAHFPM